VLTLTLARFSCYVGTSATLSLLQEKTANMRHALHEAYVDKKVDNEQRSCDDTLDVHSVSPVNYQHKVTCVVQTTDRGTFYHAHSVFTFQLSPVNALL